MECRIALPSTSNALETAANHDAAVGLKSDGHYKVAIVNFAVNVARIVNAFGVVMIRQPGELIIRRIHETGVHPSVAQQARDPEPSCFIDILETTTHQNAAVSLQLD